MLKLKYVLVIVSVIVLGYLFLFANYSVTPSEDLTQKNRNGEQEEKYNVVKVFYATDRNTTETDEYNEKFGSQRGEKLSYGELLVSIPFDHQVGEIESPSIYKFEFSEDPEKHIKIIEFLEQSKLDFFSAIKSRLSNASKKDALIFIHGYNVIFSDAAKRTAQMTFDLKFNGVSAFYSWPSVGDLSAYTNDEANIKWSEKHIEEFLTDFAKASSADNIYVIAHSMGNRGLTRAIANLFEKEPLLAKKFKEIILAAPDIDADIFKRDILPRLTKPNVPITLYVSKEDQALIASKNVHGYPRAGEEIIIAEGLETIDATGIDTSLLGHSYFSETQSVLADIFDITEKNLRAKERKSLIKSDNNLYWIFKDNIN